MQGGESREFYLGEDFFRRLQRNSLASGAVVIAVLFTSLVVVPAYYAPRQTLASTLAVGGLLCAIMPFAMMRGYRRMATRYRALRIVLFPQGLKRSLPGQEDAYIAAHEVSRVLVSPGNGCGVEGMAGQQAIWLPATLRGYEEIMQAVAAWRAPETKAGFWRNSGTQSLATAAFLVAMLVVMQAENRLLVTAVSVPLAAYTVWAAIVLRRSAYVTATQKRGAVTLWILMALIAMKLVNLWLA